MRHPRPHGPRHGPRRAGWHAACALSAVSLCSPAMAVKIDMPDPDLAVSLDTTLRYNAAVRTKAQEAGLMRKFGIGGGDSLVDKNDIALSRLDLYSELDLAYKGNMGLRVSAAAWYDTKFPSSNPNVVTGSTYPGNAFNDYVKRYYQGPSGEVLDAFAWSNLKLGESELNLKVGRLAWLPGEFLIANGNSLSFSMAPSDGQKGDLSPGASAKETALPIAQIAANWQLLPDLTLMGQYTLEFRSSRISEGGTFFNTQGDTMLNGPSFVVPGTVPRLPAFEGEKGDIGLGIKWSPQWANGAISAWYRKFDDKNPTWGNQIYATAFITPAPGVTLPQGTARAVYAKNIELLGLAYNTVLASWSLGAEFNVRKNMPLASTGLYGSIPVATVNDPTLEGARGRTVHALLSAVQTLNKNALFDSGVLVFQLDYTRLSAITKNANLFNGAAGGVPGRCANEEALRGCSTRDALSAGAVFTPTWQQVFPSMDISLPIVALYGLKGTPAALGTSMLPEQSWLFKGGLRLEWVVGKLKHQFDLGYTTRGGRTGVLPGQSALTYSGLANFRDRNYLSFTYQTGF
ncbi:MAG TPA: DUF1302 family protein [Albitalea sp.]|uniref:DUF1302 domain-containing protein n=1 Tax=Piscinibacter sp. TaxID=1903157 RepID=UPI002ED3840F